MLQVKALAFLIWTALISWVPPGDQTRAWREPEAQAAGRYWDVAESIAYVVLDPDEAPLPIGPGGEDEARARTGLLLASVLSFESFVVARVIDCRKLGPGNARGPYQCEGSRCADACRGVESATRLALAMLRASFKACRGGALQDALSQYTDGACHANWARSRTRFDRAERWHRAHPLAWSEGLREGFGDWD